MKKPSMVIRVGYLNVNSGVHYAKHVQTMILETL
jgi:hypothetical protein